MNPLHPTQDLLIQYLYGLLDEDQHRQVEELVQSTPEWKAALDQAKEQQTIFAEAAKSEFSDVQFQEPQVDTMAREPISTGSNPKPERSWTPWLIAASLLVVILAGGIGGYSWYQPYSQYTRAQQDLSKLLNQQQQFHVQCTSAEENAREAIREPLQEMRRLQRQIMELEKKFTGEVEKANKKIQEQQFQVIITGPQTIQAGAHNEYQIQTNGLKANRGKKVPTKVTARVVAPEKDWDVLYEKKIDNKDGICNLVLPKNLPVKPGKQLHLQVVAEGDAGIKAQVSEHLPLVGKLYMTHLATDRPLYKPGNTVRFRSLTLDRFSLKPAEKDFLVTFKIYGPDKSPIWTQQGTTHVTGNQKTQKLLTGPKDEPIRGIAAGEFKISEDAPGGEYTLEIQEAKQKFPTQKRKFIVQRFIAPRLDKELEFHRKSYGPGDEVEVLCKVSRVEGGHIKIGSLVEVDVQVDGKKVKTSNVRIDEKGKVPPIQFTLPEEIANGKGSISVTFHDGGVIETIPRPIPIVTKKLFIDFFPEGGDLVAGVTNRVYFRAKSTLGKPAELRGNIVDQDGNPVTEVFTLNDDKEVGVNQGLGRFEFTPQLGKMYQLKIDAPLGIESIHRLPLAKKDGVVLTIPDGVVTDKINLKVISAKKDRNLLVGAYCRGGLIDHKTVKAKAGKFTPVTLQPTIGVSGVYRVTVFEEVKLPQRIDYIPVAERLIFRRPKQKLNFTILTDKGSYTPGNKVKVKVTCKDENQELTPTIMLVSVVDQSIIKLADDKTDRSMPTHFFLSTEIEKPEDLEYADFLVSDNPKAEKALDLLLGTQGWRRFVEQDPQVAQKKAGPEVNRLLVANGLNQKATKDLVRQAKERLEKEFAPAWKDRQVQLAELEKEYPTQKQELENELIELQKNNRQKAQELTALVTQKTRETQKARNQYQERQSFLIQAFLGLGGVLLLLLGVYGIVTGIIRSSQQVQGAGLHLILGMACLLLLFLGGAFGVGYYAFSPDREDRLQKMAMSENQMVPEEEIAGFNQNGMADDRFQEMPAAGAAPQPDNAPPLPPKAVNPNVRAPAPNAKIAGRDGNKAEKFLRNRNEGKGAGQGKGKQANDKRGGDNRLEKAGKKRIQGQKKPGHKRPLQPKADAKKPADGANLKALEKQQQALRKVQEAVQEQGMAKKELQLAKDAMKAFGGRRNRQLNQLGQAADRRWDAQPESRIRAEGDFARLAQRRLGGYLNTTRFIPTRPFLVREYAHTHQTDEDNTRRDFTQTLYWHPVLVAKDGKAEFSFDLSDSITTFQVKVWGHSLNGRLGAKTHKIISKLPFSVDPKIPVEITNNDKVIIPVAIANDTELPRAVDVTLTGTNLKVVGQEKRSFALIGNQRARQLFHLRATQPKGIATVLMEGDCAPFSSDRIEKTFKIVPEGFPIEGSMSDYLEGVARHNLKLPKTWVKGSLQCKVQVYPSTLADLQKGLEGMLREPRGCFEQTSTSNYPNVMILSYLEESDQVQPEIEKRARGLLQRGYNRLTSFECMKPSDRSIKRGYEWFGRTAPPHEALTAYGLLQFKDIARFQKVDPEMVARTEKYLLGQRDGKGGFKRNSRALDTFGRAPEHITNAYIVWALTEAGTKANISKELNALQEQAANSKDPYFLTLVAIGLLNSGKNQEAVDLLKEVRNYQEEDGHLHGAQTSITRSGGRSLQIETTALAVLGWLRANRPADFQQNIQNAVEWIGKQRGGHGSFGSTQSTILALKALVAYTRDNRKTAEAGELKLFLEGRDEPIAVTSFPAGAKDEIVVSIPNEELLRPGDNNLRIEITGNNQFPYTLSWSYNTLKPANPASCPVHITTKLDRNRAKEGNRVRLTTVVENKSGEGQGMAVAVIGLPAGLIPVPVKQLQEMARLRENGTKPGEIAHWETRGRELILYWRQLAPEERIEINLDLICEIPGEYRGPASRAYLYYNPDLKFWTNPLSMVIEPSSN